MSKLLAVYGTLKQDKGNHHYLDSAEYLGTHVTEPKYTMHSMGGFPAVTLEGTTPITVEVYKVEDKNTINNINMLESYTGQRNNPRNWYDTVDVETPYGLAEMYYFKERPNNNIVKDGIW